MLSREKLIALAPNLISSPEHYMDSFRENVRMYIDQKEITLAEVSELADIPESTLKSFIYGKSEDCHLSTAIKLAKVFRVSVDELVGCGTLSPITTESIQITRQFPESYMHFIRWSIRMHQAVLNSTPAANRFIEVMNPAVGPYGNLKISYDLELVDISNLPDDIRPKITMGIRIPNNQFNPIFNENDIVLLANDRLAYPNEIELKCHNDNLWFLKYKKLPNGEYKYCSLRDNVVAPPPEDIELTFGYIVKVVRSMNSLSDD